MEKMPPPEQLPRNLNTKRRHQREVFWQITFPMVAVCVILIVLSVLVIQGSAAQVSLWADVSLIWLIVPMLFISLLVTLFLAAFVYLTVQLVRWLPYYSYRALVGLRQVDRRVRHVSNSAVRPFLRYHSVMASLGALKSQVRRRSLPRR